MTRSWVLEQRGDALVSLSHLMCGFVPMRGAGEHRGVSVPLLGDGVVGLWQDEGDAIATAELAGVLDGPRAEAWTGVTIAASASSADLDLWLATALSGFCLMTARQEAIDDGTVNLVLAVRDPRARGRPQPRLPCQAPPRRRGRRPARVRGGRAWP